MPNPAIQNKCSVTSQFVVSLLMTGQFSNDDFTFRTQSIDKIPQFPIVNERAKYAASNLNTANPAGEIHQIHAETGGRARTPEGFAYLIVSSAQSHRAGASRHVGREDHATVVTIAAQIGQIDADVITCPISQPLQVGQRSMNLREIGQVSLRIGKDTMSPIKLRQQAQGFADTSVKRSGQFRHFWNVFRHQRGEQSTLQVGVNFSMSA